MSAIDELRRMLDERGVEHEGGERSVRWRDRNGVMMQAFPLADGELGMDVWSCTPEQAIAATLGLEPDDAAMGKLHDRMNVALLECERTLGIEKADGTIVVPLVFEMHNLLEEAAALGSCNCTNDYTNGERTGTCLPHFWTHDGVLHIELPKLPESISVRLPDQRDREVGSARVWQYTRGSGTCQKVYLVETSDDLIESWYPIGVYLNSKAAGDCADALRGEVDGIQQFARVVELKVVDE